MGKSTRATLLTACVPAFLLLAAQIASAQDTEIRVVCSNGFRAAFEKLRPDAERAIGRPLKVQFGASRNLKESIEGGEPFDLAILTPQIIDDLTKAGKIAAGTKVDLASSGVGIAVRAGRPKPDIGTASAMKQTLLAAKSIGYVQVGAGTPAILDMLSRLGISEDVKPKTVFQSGAEESMKNLADGKLDVDFALISEILPAPGVQLAGPLPAEFQRRVVMAAGIASSTKNREEAGRFVKSLTSSEAAKTIKAVGMDPVAQEK
jgi:molybdate transport system substrate-binding protein